MGTEAGTTIRPAEKSDYVRIAALSAELGSLDAFPEREDWLRRVAPHTLVAAGSTAAGYIVAQPEGDVAVLSALVVAPEHRRRGLARLLMDAAAQTLRDAGRQRWRLNVKRTNDAAIRLYERAGFVTAGSTLVVRIDRAVSERLRPSRETKVVPVADAQILPADRPLVRAPNEPWLGITLHGQLIGYCRVLPQYPSLKPFRCASPDHARHLLEAAWLTLLQPATSLLVALDDAPDLGGELLRCGATIELDIVRMTGALPGPSEADSG